MYPVNGRLYVAPNIVDVLSPDAVKRYIIEFIFLFYFIDDSDSLSDVVVTTPKAQCQGVSLTDSRDLPAYMYVKWEILNSTRPADIPLMFVLSTHDIVLGKVGAQSL